RRANKVIQGLFLFISSARSTPFGGEPLKLAHHLLAVRFEPQRLEFLEAQGPVLVGVQPLVPFGAIVVDLLLADLAILVGVIAFDKVAHAATMMAAPTAPAASVGEGLAGERAHAQSGQSKDSESELGLVLHPDLLDCDWPEDGRRSAI